MHRDGCRSVKLTTVWPTVWWELYVVPEESTWFGGDHRRVITDTVNCRFQVGELPLDELGDGVYCVAQPLWDFFS